MKRIVISMLLLTALGCGIVYANTYSQLITPLKWNPQGAKAHFNGPLTLHRVSY